MTVDEDKVFIEKVMAEIDDEVRRRRAAGDFPPSFERRLDLLFNRFTPVGVNEGHFAETLKIADRAAYVDIEVPLLSEMPGGSFIKRTLKKLMAWYFNYVVQQITRFTSATMRVLHMIDERLTSLEDEALVHRPTPIDEEDLPSVSVDISGWVELVREKLAKAQGRVLHLECADASLVAALVADGLDAYGVDPRAQLLDAPAAAGLDVRREEALSHLRAVSDGSLGALVISGCLDRLAVRYQRELVELAGAKLRPDGPLVLLGASPNWWSRNNSVVEADLAPGRPLHPQTWCHLLGRQGFGSFEVVWGPAERGLEPVSDSNASASEINANLEKLNEALYGPASFSVSCTRGS